MSMMKRCSIIFAICYLIVASSFTAANVSTKVENEGEDILVQSVLKKIDELDRKVTESNVWVSPKTLMPLFVGIIAAFSGLLIAERSSQRARNTQSQTQHEQHLVDSLRWFAENTTGRGIGIAVVKANWKSFPRLQPTWTSIMVWQSGYLISQSKRKREATEVTNLQNMRRLLETAQLTDDQKEDLKLAFEARDKEGKGHDLKPEELAPWKELAGLSNT